MNINFKVDTQLPEFMVYPKFLVGSELSYIAREVYVLLLDRARLSQKNGWYEQQRNVFVIYAVEDIAKRIKKSRSRVFTALKELQEAGLIFRKRVVFSGANRILVRIPEFQKEDDSDTENDTAAV